MRRGRLVRVVVRDAGRVAPRGLRELLGHRDIKLTLRYAHLASGHRRDEIDKTAAPIAARPSDQNQHDLVESTSRRPQVSETPG